MPLRYTHKHTWAHTQGYDHTYAHTSEGGTARSGTLNGHVTQKHAWLACVEPPHPPEVYSLPHPRRSQAKEGKARKPLWMFMCTCVFVHGCACMCVHACAQGLSPPPQTAQEGPWWRGHHEEAKAEQETSWPKEDTGQARGETRMLGNKGWVLVPQSFLSPTCFKA